MRFYRHCDGYPNGHGIDMARGITLADKKGIVPEYWVQGVLEFFFVNDVGVEFEPYGCEHGDIEYLYVVEGIVDHRWGRRKDDTLPVTISVYQHSLDEPYISTELNTKPIFSGTAYEYIEKYGEGVKVGRQGSTVFDQQVGERARHIREILSMTMQEVADQLGVTRQTLGNYENGATPMRADVVRSLCEVYGVPSSWMLGMTDGLHCKWNRGGRTIELSEQSKHIESLIQEQKDEVE